MAPKSTVKASRNHNFQSGNTTDNPIQTEKKAQDPRISWPKGMCFMLALAAEHQKKKSLGGVESTNWNAVLEVMNEMLRRYPAFGADFPQGLDDSGRLRSQFTERYRPHEKYTDRHRKPSWALEHSACTTDEIARLTPLTDAVINAEIFLSNQPNSLVTSPAADALRWPQYDIVLPVPRATKGTKRAQELTSDVEPDHPVKVARQRKSSKTSVDEEEEPNHAKLDRKSGSPAPPPNLGRRRANETPAEGPSRHQASAGPAHGSDAQFDAPVRARRRRKAAEKPVVAEAEEAHTADHRGAPRRHRQHPSGEGGRMRLKQRQTVDTRQSLRVSAVALAWTRMQLMVVSPTRTRVRLVMNAICQPHQ